MAIERRLGTEENPDIMDNSTAVEIMPEPSRTDEIQNAAQVLVNEQEILIDDEIDALDPMPNMSFDSNLVDFVDESILEQLASDLVSSVESDKQSRSEWEKTYTDGLKYLGMKFDESRSQPFEGSSGVIHPILAEGS
jgi:hypothetical protein